MQGSSLWSAVCKDPSAGSGRPVALRQGLRCGAGPEEPLAVVQGPAVMLSCSTAWFLLRPFVKFYSVLSWSLLCFGEGLVSACGVAW